MGEELHISNDNWEYIARISHGKDSLKMLDVIITRGLRLDRITSTDVWATDTIRAELPEMVAFKDRADEYIWQKYRIEVEHLCAIDFNQGLDIRLLNDADIADINKMRIKTLHFAWDNPKDDLEGKFKVFADGFRRKSNIGMVYCLVNFGSTMEENLYRIYTLRDLGYDPYVMIYNKPNASKEVRRLQRWVNNKLIFKTTKKFEDYNG